MKRKLLATLPLLIALSLLFSMPAIGDEGSKFNIPDPQYRVVKKVPINKGETRLFEIKDNGAKVVAVIDFQGTHYSRIEYRVHILGSAESPGSKYANANTQKRIGNLRLNFVGKAGRDTYGNSSIKSPIIIVEIMEEVDRTIK